MVHGWMHLQPQDREAILRGLADGQVYGGPYHLELDWVDKCNARCFFCNSENLHNGESIPWERAERLLNEAVAHDLRSVRLSGGGEPTLHPHFADLLDLLGSGGVILDNLTTNGAQLTDRVLEAMMQVRVQEVRVSLNYCDEASYAQGMGLPAHFFGRVCEMTRKLNEARKRHKSFGRLMLQFFLYKPTMHQVRPMYDLGRELGADVITFRELSDVDRSLYFAPQDVASILDQLRDVIREDWSEGRVEVWLESHGIDAKVRSIYDEMGRELGGRPSLAPAQFNMGIRYCYIGWYSMTILGTQAVYPCCFLLPFSGLPALDSLRDKSVQEVWRGAAYARFRKEMRDYFLLKERIPGFDRRVKTITPGCASHGDCPLAPALADEAFFEEADRRLARVRRRPDVAAWRLANHAGRFLERRLAKRHE
jgi:MoaA/NifB/PqqE/SkfB family radical SAM enzyme